MKGRIWTSVAMSAIGVSLLAAAMLAGSAAGGTQAAAKKQAGGGSITVTNRSDFDYVDPGLSYFSHTWSMMSASQLTLLYYPHVEGAAGGRLTPMASQGMPKVSNDGKTYTFTIKKGFKFSDGTTVTSANFKRAFDRALNKDMQSPASSFLDDVASYKAPNAEHVRRHPEEGRSGLPGPDVDDVLRRRAGEPAVHGRGRQGADGLRRPVLPEGVERRRPPP